MEELITGKRELSPDAASVAVLPNHTLRVRFINGELRDFDMSPLLSRKCYQALNNDILFQTAAVAFGTVQWANGLDIDPEWLYMDSVPVDFSDHNKSIMLNGLVSGLLVALVQNLAKGTAFEQALVSP